MCQNKSVHLTVWKPQENTSLMFEQYSVTCPEIRAYNFVYSQYVSFKTKD